MPRIALWLRAWDTLKRSLSRAWDGLWSRHRRPVPRFPTPQAAWDYLAARYTYTGDPLHGVIDFYWHPEVLQAALEAGTAASLPVDCDDVAAWAYVALAQLGAAPQLVALFDAGVRGCHAICVYTWQGACGAIDTNGVHALPDLEPATLCAHWGRIYAAQGVRYLDAVPVDYPF